MIDIDFPSQSQAGSLSAAELLDYLHQYQQTFFQPAATQAPSTQHPTIVLIGMGGSAMGARFYYHFFKEELSKNLIIIDNIHPDWVAKKLQDLDLANTMFVAVSKTGNTLETVMLTQLVLQYLKRAKLPTNEHLCVVTDNTENQISQIAEQHKLPNYLMPSTVGGRFSVFSNAAMVPLSLVGVDTAKLMEQAQQAFQKFLDAKFNVVQTLAEFLYHHSLSSRNNLVVFNYEPRLSWFGPWLAQLLCESLGKNNSGLQVISARGTTDQHSMTQHWKQGIDNSIIMFIQSESYKQKLQGSYSGKELDFGEITEQFLQANQQVFQELNRANFKFKIANQTGDLVDLSALWMLVTSYLGARMQINAFNQPAVDFSKKILQKNLNL